MKKKYPIQRPVAVDLFSGAGGLSLGFEQAGFDISFAVDQDGWHAATHERNFPYGVSLCRSVTDLTGEEIRRLAGLDGDIDLVTGGPPCQGFSHMGSRDRSDPRSSLVFQFARLVSELRPKAFVMENVAGMLSGEAREFVDQLIESFESFGYRITKPLQTLNARDFGVPQDRNRLFLLGLREDLGTTLPYPEGPCSGQPPRPTVAEAIEGLPEVEQYEELMGKTDKAPYPESAVLSAYARVAMGLAEDPSDLSRPRLWDRSTVSGCLRVRHAAKTIALYAATKPGTSVPGHKLPRLSPTGLCPTLRAGSDSLRGAHTAPRPVHPELPRVITAREAARLHGYPDWFSFFPTKWHAYRQIGNSVCPPVSRAVGEKLMQILVDRGSVKLSTRLPKAVSLTDQFDLPKDRPRSQRRISHLDELPKVINWLFARAFDDERGELSKASFSHADISTAIAATKAKLPRIKPESYLQTVARSRSVEKILAVPLAKGFSVEITAGGGAFLPATEAVCIHQKDTIPVRSGELANATALAVEDEAPLEQLISSTIRAFYDCAPERVELDMAARRQVSESLVIVPARLPTPKRQGQALVVIVDDSVLPFKSRLLRLTEGFKAPRLVVVGRVTAKHLLVVELRRQGIRLKETSRMAFQVSALSEVWDDSASKTVGQQLESFAETAGDFF